MTTTRVQVVPNGPVLVSGPVRIEMPGGEVVESDRFMVAICTCRRSGRYPLCDTSHRRCRRLKASADSSAPAGSAATSDSAPTTS
ncbi:CDGSH iron-sulfur domain-containing protein [Mycobacterium colombiense]|uniref:CDGSH iron-sulfur domain-containing protein n=1 Tax=Mycobacterium colombiense TaxID=339268 RepID=UPI000949ED10|nr:CDGSH iron-sulfur domain-containing protein [Mycobacterium colombiense]